MIRHMEGVGRNGRWHSRLHDRAPGDVKLTNRSRGRLAVGRPGTFSYSNQCTCFGWKMSTKESGIPLTSIVPKKKIACAARNDSSLAELHKRRTSVTLVQY